MLLVGLLVIISSAVQFGTKEDHLTALQDKSATSRLATSKFAADELNVVCDFGPRSSYINHKDRKQCYGFCGLYTYEEPADLYSQCPNLRDVEEAEGPDWMNKSDQYPFKRPACCLNKRKAEHKITTNETIASVIDLLVKTTLRGSVGTNDSFAITVVGDSTMKEFFFFFFRVMLSQQRFKGIDGAALTQQPNEIAPIHNVRWHGVERGCNLDKLPLNSTRRWYSGNVLRGDVIGLSYVDSLTNQTLHIQFFPVSSM
jgi:hypothetical protein